MLKLKTVAKGVQFAGKLQFCEHCAQFKSTAKPFNNHGEKATKPDMKKHPRSPEGYEYSLDLWTNSVVRSGLSHLDTGRTQLL